MASHTALFAPPLPSSRKPIRSRVPDAAVSCQRRPDVFQHPLLENARPKSEDSASQRRHHLVLLHTARDLCASCPLWAECLQDAIAHVEPHGYTAATTAEDRRSIRRRLGIGDENGDLPIRDTTRSGGTSAAWRLARLRSRAGGSVPFRPLGDHDVPELEQILDAFDMLQEQWERQQDLLKEAQAEASAPAPARSDIPSRTEAPLEDRGEDPMAGADSGQRIVFSLEDPAEAVRQALLGPLVRSALPTVFSVEQVAAMLTRVPGGDVGPETLNSIRDLRAALASMLPTDDGPSAGSGETDEASGPSLLTGSVGVKLAMTDPVAALRRDFLRPLLRDLLLPLSNIEKVATMLTATTDGDRDTRLERVRTALHELQTFLPRIDTSCPPVGNGSQPLTSRSDGSPDTGPRDHPAATSSVRAAVVRTVATFPSAFSAGDVLHLMPPSRYGATSKTISNVLSTLVKSGQLERVSRGTYARLHDLADGNETTSS
ncbi:WhiB family transcriptional regulator [Streptomyces niveus]|uniref:WhiB family transcriptional regulator n=1 Tax=Streptomyces niveus TaxID=193462 RepID=UPI00343F852D